MTTANSALSRSRARARREKDDREADRFFNAVMPNGKPVHDCSPLECIDIGQELVAYGLWRVRQDAKRPKARAT